MSADAPVVNTSRAPLRVSYFVIGDAVDAEMPYRNHLTSFREALAIAREYVARKAAHPRGQPYIRICREFGRPVRRDSVYPFSTYQSHEWRVFPEGGMQLVSVHRHWQAQRVTRGVENYTAALPRLHRSAIAPDARTQLEDLSWIARQIGLDDATPYLLSLIRKLPPDRRGATPATESTPSVTSSLLSAVDRIDEGAWPRVKQVWQQIRASLQGRQEPKP